MPPCVVAQNQVLHFAPILPSRIPLSLLLESIQRLHTLALVVLLIQNKGCLFFQDSKSWEAAIFWQKMINEEFEGKKFTCSLNQIDPNWLTHVVLSHFSTADSFPYCSWTYQLWDLHCWGFLHEYAKTIPQRWAANGMRQMAAQSGPVWYSIV